MKGKNTWNSSRLVSEETKAKLSEAFKGEKSHFWKGGATEINKLLRTRAEYKNWRRAVFERDNHACVLCGDNQGGNLNADHIKPFSQFPELRYEISNGRTLCIPCHKETPSYGFKKGCTPWNKVKVG